MQRYEKPNTIIKTLKFDLITEKKQSDILEKITSKHSYGVRLYLSLIKKNQEKLFEDSRSIAGKLDELTITTKKRLFVPYDFKTKTKLNTSVLAQCGRHAIEMWKSYQVKHNEWNNSASIKCIKYVLEKLCNIEVDSNGNFLFRTPSFDNSIIDFSKSKIWSYFKKSEPSEPSRSPRNKTKKLPIRLRRCGNFLGIHFSDSKLFIKLATLKPRQPIVLEMRYGDYHIQELENAEALNGKIIKNIRDKKWEFHLTIRKPIKEKITSFCPDISLIVLYNSLVSLKFLLMSAIFSISSSTSTFKCPPRLTR